MNYKNEKSKFHHSHKLLIKGRIMKPVTLENVLKMSIHSSKFCALGLCMTLSKKKYFWNLHNLQNYRTNEVQEKAVTKSCSRVKVFLKIAVCKSFCLLEKELFYNNFSLIYTSFFHTTFIEHLTMTAFLYY